MKIAIIGRTEMLYETAKKISKEHKIEVIITSPSAPEYQKNEEDFKKLAADLGAQFFNVKDVNKPEIIAAVKDLDLGVSVNWVNIIQQEFIKSFRIGVLNAHAGDLPRYRGNACPNWAIINGEKEVAVSIHLMEAGVIDAGPIIAQEKYPLEVKTKITDIYNWLRIKIPVLMENAIKLVSSDPAYCGQQQSKDPAESLRCYPRFPFDSEIKWPEPAEKILRLIKASTQPFGGAYSFFAGNKIIIWDADLVADQENYVGVPGQIAGIDKEKGFVIVITGQGKLKLLEVSYNEYDHIPPARVVRSSRSRLGMNYSEEIIILKQEIKKLKLDIEKLTGKN